MSYRVDGHTHTCDSCATTTGSYPNREDAIAACHRRPAPAPIPAGVYYCPEGGNFYSVERRRGMGLVFWSAWRERRHEFPTSAEDAVAGLAIPAPAPRLEEAVEAARRMRASRYIGSEFIADARTVARALLALTRGDEREVGAATRASEGPTAPITDCNPKE